MGANETSPGCSRSPLRSGCTCTGIRPFDSSPARGHTHTAGGDLPEGHDYYDLNSNVNVASAYDYLLATANFTGDTSAEDYGRLHVEWETGSVPKFVWPTEGDSVSLWGSWIWDCGHW